jgi:hypothetical protein
MWRWQLSALSMQPQEPVPSKSEWAVIGKRLLVFLLLLALLAINQLFGHQISVVFRDLANIVLLLAISVAVLYFVRKGLTPRRQVSPEQLKRIKEDIARAIVSKKSK